MQLIDAIRDFINGNQLQAYIVAVAILVITAIVARLCSKLVHHFVDHDGSPIPASSILLNTIRIAIWLVGIAIILSACFDINVSGMIAALGVGGIALSLGLQDTMTNFFAGIQVTLLKIVAPGEHIKVGSSEGIVTDVTWRQTTMKDFMGNVHVIPNSLISSEEVITYDPENIIYCQIVIDNTGQSLDDNIKKMEAAARDAITSITPLKKDPWIQLQCLQQDVASGVMRFVLEDLKNVEEARDAALRAIAPYAVPSKNSSVK